MKTLLFITTRLFWPADSGRKVVLYNYCKGAAEQLGYEVHLFSFLEGGQEPGDISRKPDFISSVTLASPVSPLEKAKNMAGVLMDGRTPFQCCLFESAANHAALDDLVRTLQPDVVVADMIRLAPYIDSPACRSVATVVNFDDLLSKRYRRQVGKTGESVLGKYGEQASGLLRRISGGPLKDAVLAIEASRCERAEGYYAEVADASLFISPIEAGEFASRADASACFCATMGADVLDTVGQDGPWFYDFGFVGNMHTAANQDSLRFLVGEVLPLLPGCSLRVIGVCPDGVMEAYKGNPAVSFAGRVDSIAEHLGQCKMLLAPFAYGSGIKTKVLEAMGMGVSVVTNSIGLEGIAACPGIDVLCADDAEGLAREARRLLADEAFRRGIAESGRAYVAENHTWDKSIDDLGKCFDYAIGQSARRRG